MARGAWLVLAAGVTLASAAAAQESNAAIKPDCAGDYSRLCYTLPVTDPRAGGCLQSHFQELSPGCQAALKGGPLLEGGPSEDLAPPLKPQPGPP
ncbi:MAG TPA: hypothetical protein VHD15_16360 [Hyphomicrobiales bacterium]|nr:hypothetical protein [Hyphomicrobiales bacterium]